MIRMVLQILIQTVTSASMIHLKLFIPSGTTSCWYLPYCSSLLVSAVSSFCSFLQLWLLLGGRIGQNDLRYLKSPKVYTNHPGVPAQTLIKWTPIRIVSCAFTKTSDWRNTMQSGNQVHLVSVRIRALPINNLCPWSNSLRQHRWLWRSRWQALHCVNPRLFVLIATQKKNERWSSVGPKKNCMDHG